MKRKIRVLCEIFFVLVFGCLQTGIVSCGFFDDGEKSTESSSTYQISAIRLTSSKVSTQVGGISYIGFTTTPSYPIDPVWSYDASIIEIEKQASGVVIKGVSEGQCPLTVSYQQKSATAIVTVEGYADTYVDTSEPYIYSDTQVVQMQPNDTERIHVSLYNGTAADIDGYTWTIENPAVASISPTGQYCQIRSLTQGYSRIKVTHAKAPYPYYIGIYVLEDISKVTFITTKQNIVKMNCTDGDKSISVSLTNPKSENYAKDFSWQITEGSEHLALTANGENCVLTPISQGTSYVRVTHPDAQYPLDITIRTVEIIQKVYIQPDNTIVNLNGNETQKITCTLKNIEDGEYSVDDFSYLLDSDSAAQIDYSIGNTVAVRGLANGSCNLIISHPKSAYRREVLLIVSNQVSDAIDSSFFITTSQNYIKTKVGAEDTTVNIMLKGGTNGEENDFIWEVRQNPLEEGKDVISVSTTTGEVTAARMAGASYAYGIAHISPLAEGTAVITLRHPKAYYPTEMLVKVLNAGALLENPLYFSGSGIAKFLNSEQYTYTVSLLGSNKRSGDENDIRWESDSPALNISASANQAVLTSRATGSNISHMTITHPKADNPKNVLVLTADTQEELDSIKAFYADKTYYSINVGASVSISASHVGFDTYDADGNVAAEFDFTLATWTSSDPSIASVEKSENPLSATVRGNKSGTATVTVSYGTEASLSYNVTVYPEGVNIASVDPSRYLTTSQNVINLSGAGASKSASVGAIGISASKYSQIRWQVMDASVASVAANGTSATVTAVCEGETSITVSHPDSENALTIHVRVGSEYVMGETSNIPCIAAPNVITMLTGDPSRKLTASIENYSGNASTGDFRFSIDNERTASIAAQSSNGTAYIKPVAAGSAEITITHTRTDVSKKVLVVVADTAAEISGILAKSVYLTTSNNVIAIESIGESVKARLAAANLDLAEQQNIVWTSADESVASVISNGTSATITANGSGRTCIYATHKKSLNALTYWVFVGEKAIQDASSGGNSGGTSTGENGTDSVIGISVPNVITLTEDDADYRLTAVLTGHSGLENDGFSFAVKDTSVARIASQSSNGTAYINPVSAGYTEITVAHTATDITRKVLVAVAKSVTEISQTLAKPVYLTAAANVITIQNEGLNALVKVSAANLDASEYSKIRWTSADEGVAGVLSNGTSATITANGSGKTCVYATYAGSLNTATFYVFVGEKAIQDAATPAGNQPSGGNSGGTSSGGDSSGQGQTTPGGMSAVVTAGISSANVITLALGDANRQLTATLTNYSGTDTDGFSFAVKDSGVARIASQSTNGTAYVKPVSDGYTEITISHKSTDVTKKVLVVVAKTEEAAAQSLAKLVYMTTTDNVLRLTAGGSATVRVTVANLSMAEQQGIVWTSADNAVASVIANGASATVTANGTGICTVRASYPGSANSITFHVFVAAASDGGSSGGTGGTSDTGGNGGTSGNGIMAASTGITSANVITLAIGDADRQLTATLSNYSGTDTDGFSFAVKDSGVARIASQSTNGTAYVKPVSDGYTEITISHKSTDVTKKVLVVVAKTEEAAAQSLAKLVYMTTASNILFLSSQGSRGTLSLSANGLSALEANAIKWASEDESIATVIGNGESATVRAVKSGQTTITATHSACANSIRFYVYVAGETTAQTQIPQSIAPVYIATNVDDLHLVKGAQTTKIQAALVNYTGSETHKFSFSVDNENVISVIAQYATGTCYISPKNAGQAEITVSHPDAKLPKKILIIVSNTAEELSEIKYITTTANVVNISEKTTKSISVNLENATDVVIGGYTWKSADSSIASIVQTTSGTVLVSGNKIGTTTITVTHEQSKYPLVIIIQVVDPIATSASPFIQVPTPILTLVESTAWTTLTAELVGGTDSDNVNFIWNIFDGAEIVDLYYQNGIAKVRAKKAGSAIVRVSHQKAAYPQDIRLICDAASSTEYSISVSSGNIMSIRPDAGDQIITATLVNGSATDKYNFKWSMDVYDVIDLTYSANTAIITPLKEGTATITVSHPKAAYDQQIAVKVQQYSSFDFSTVSKSVIAGQSTFVTMEVPASSVETKVAYTSENEKIAKISGTNSVCQITGVNAGTVTVHAQLIAKKTDTVQATADMLVIVSPGAENLVYINGTAGLATTFTMTLNTSKVMTAELTGDEITLADNTNLVWSVPKDQDCIRLANADSSGKASGNSAYITAQKAGETTLTITHEKTSYALVYHIIVPGADRTEVTLDKNYVSIERGKTTTVKATVSSGKSSDYKLVKWSISRIDGVEIATVNGAGTDGIGGQTVTIYGIKAGTVYLRCDFPESGSFAECQVTVNDPKSLELNQTVLRVLPNATKTFSYKVSPPDADINWVYAGTLDGSTIFDFIPNGHTSSGEGTVTILGIKEGTSKLSGISSYGNTVSIQIQVAWDYKFQLNKTSIKGSPENSYTINYNVNPPDARIDVEENDFYRATVTSGSWVTETWDFQGAKTDLSTIQGSAGKVKGTSTSVLLEVNAAKGKLSQRTSDAQFNSGTVIRVPVQTGSIVKVVSYPGYHNYKVAGTSAEKDTTTYTSGEDGYVDIMATGESYLYSISATYSTGNADGTGTITLTPLYAGNETITITARNPMADDDSSLIGEKDILVSFEYDKVTTTLSVVSDTEYGTTIPAYYSECDDDGNCIYIGDGEALTLNVSVDQPKIKVTDIKINNNLESQKGVEFSSDSDGKFRLFNRNDVKTPGYKIIEGWRPTLNGSTSYQDGTPIKLEHFTTVFSGNFQNIHGDNTDAAYFSLYNEYAHTTVYTIQTPLCDSGNFLASVSRYGNWLISTGGQTLTNLGTYGEYVAGTAYKQSGTGWGKVRDESLDGTYYSVDQFQKIRWYYLPAFSAEMDTTHFCQNTNVALGENACYVSNGNFKCRDTILSHPAGEIDETNIKAEYQDVVHDTSVQSEDFAGSITVNVTHETGTKSVTYNVYLRTRNCACTLPK